MASLDGRVLTLAFANQGPMRNFQSGANADYLRDAISDLLGVDLEVRCEFVAAQGGDAHGVVAHDAAALGSMANPGAGPAAPPPHEGFAPGDEAEAEDPDAPRVVDRSMHGEDAALRLVESELGGRIVGTVGE